jgi:hypothetical protein
MPYTVPIKGTFRLGNPVLANRAGIVSGNGNCRIFADAGATRLVASFSSAGDDVRFQLTNLDKGVIICQ